MVSHQVHLGMSAALGSAAAPASTAHAHRSATRNAAISKDAFRHPHCLILLPALVCLLGLPTDTAWSTEDYRVIPMNKAFEDPGNMRRMESAAKKYAFVESIEGFADVGYARAYYLMYLPARITQKEAMGEISPLLTQIRKRLARSARDGRPGAKNILQWLYTGMKGVAEGDYRPAARINAIVMISRLDIRPADSLAKTPPVPSKVIPAVLLPIYQDKNNSDGVRAAALHGLRRYANLSSPSLSKSQRDQLINEMQTLLQQQPPATRDVAAHAYLQRFAVDILTSLQLTAGSVGDPNHQASFGEQLVSISTNQASHRLLAIHAAAQIGTMDQNVLGTNVSAHQILSNWTLLVSRSLTSEIGRLEKLTRPQPAKRQPPRPDASVGLTADAKRGNAKNPQRANRMKMRNQMDPQAADLEEAMISDSANGESMNGENFEQADATTRRSAQQAPEIVMSRRKLSFVLQQLHYGAAGSRQRKLPRQPRGLLAAVSTMDQAIVADWIQVIHSTLDAINDPSLASRAAYVAKLKQLRKKLDDISLQLFTPLQPAKQPVNAPAKIQGQPSSLDTA